jgi:hypothetical protein
MRTVTRLAIHIVISTIVFSGTASAGGDPLPLVGRILLVGARSPSQFDLARWAVGRYERAGLRLPLVVVVLHDEESECHDRRGYYLGGRVDLCTGTRTDPQVRDTFLHELAHAWTDANLEHADAAAFMRLRGLRSWNSANVFWPVRGFEQAAEVISWTLGERVLSPEIPDHEPAEMLVAYRVLTGDEPPAA